MHLIQSHNLFHRLEINGETKTAINSGVVSSGPGIAKLRNSIRQSATLAKRGADSEIVTRKVELEQILSFDRSIYLVLPEYFTGKTLQDHLDYRDNFNSEKSEIICLLLELLSRDQLSLQLNPKHIIVGEDGSILILPEEWSRILSANEQSERLNKGFEQLNFPDPGNFKVQQVTAFAIAVTLYRFLSGFWPFPEEINKGRQYKRKFLYTPIELHFPELDPSWSQWFHHMFSMTQTDHYSKNCAKIRELSNQSWKRPQHDASADFKKLQKMKIKNPEILNYLKKRKIQQTNEKIKRNSTIILIAGIVSVIFIAIIITFVQALTKDLKITGLSPEEVVRTFYQSYNDLNHQYMDEATHRSAARDEVLRIINLYALSKVRQGTELREVFIPAPQWFASGNNADTPLENNLVFGVDQVRIEKLPPPSNGSILREFRVQYTLWEPSENGGLDKNNEIRLIRLQEFRRGWKIVDVREAIYQNQK